MAEIRIRTLGELAIERDGEPLKLPASKRTRSLIGYLLLTSRPHRRERLCELFWEIPDDPRGALRWSLSKIRPLVNDDDTERLKADRERVSLKCDDLIVDLRRIADALEHPGTDLARLETMASEL